MALLCYGHPSPCHCFTNQVTKNVRRGKSLDKKYFSEKQNMGLTSLRYSVGEFRENKTLEMSYE